MIDPRWIDRYLSQDFTNAGACGPGGSMVFPSLGEASWVLASSAVSPAWRMVSRKRPFNRVPPFAREEPVLMLSGLSDLRRIPRKEGLPSRTDSRRVHHVGQGKAVHEEGPDNQIDDKRESPDPPGQRQDQGGRRVGNLANRGVFGLRRQPPCVLPATPGESGTGPPQGRPANPIHRGESPRPATAKRLRPNGQNDWRGRTT